MAIAAQEEKEAFMKRVTRDIDPGCARDLLERVPRACLSFACNQEPEVLPVAVRWQDGRYLVGVPEHASCRPETGQEAVLLVDEGSYFFDLRAGTFLVVSLLPPPALFATAIERLVAHVTTAG